MNQSEGVGKPEIHLKLMVETHEKIVEGFLVAMRRHKYPSPAWHYCGIDKRMEKVKKKNLQVQDKIRIESLENCLKPSEEIYVLNEMVSRLYKNCVIIKDNK